MSSDAPSVICPRCRSSLASENHVSCGVTAAYGEGIWNVLGERAHVWNFDRDLVLADKLVGYYQHNGGSLPQDATIGACTQAAAHAGLSQGEIQDLVRKTPFVQLSRDLRDYACKQNVCSPPPSFFSTRLTPSKGDCVLDVGCSTGNLVLSRLADSQARLTGLDINLFSLRAGQQAWRASKLAGEPQWVAGDVLALPFANETFTHVTSSVTLAHGPLLPALTEIRRVLKPRSEFICTLEGNGFIRESWKREHTLRGRIGVGRMWLGHLAQEHGLEWRGRSYIGKLAGYTCYTPGYIHSAFERSGLAVQELSILTWYDAQPRLVGIRAMRSN